MGVDRERGGWDWEWGGDDMGDECNVYLQHLESAHEIAVLGPKRVQFGPLRVSRSAWAMAKIGSDMVILILTFGTYLRPPRHVP